MERIASNWAHAEVVRVPNNLCARIPDEVADEVATLTVVGERFAVTETDVRRTTVVQASPASAWGTRIPRTTESGMFRVMSMNSL